MFRRIKNLLMFQTQKKKYQLMYNLHGPLQAITVLLSQATLSSQYIAVL